MSRTIVSTAIVLGLALASFAVAQSPDRPLTNTEISGLVKTDLPETTIVMAIEFAAARGAVRFDTSPPALMELRRAGAPGGVLDAMMRAEAAMQASRAAARSTASGPTAGMPSGRGVYLRRGAGWAPLSHSLMMPEMSGGWKWHLAVGHRDHVVTLDGGRAAVQVSDRKPTFFVRGFGSGDRPYLLKLDRKKNARQLRAPVHGMVPRGMEFRDSDVKELEMNEISAGVISLRPAADLEPGEYVIASSASPGQKYLMVGFEFGVQ